MNTPNGRYFAFSKIMCRFALGKLLGENFQPLENVLFWNIHISTNGSSETHPCDSQGVNFQLLECGDKGIPYHRFCFKAAIRR